MPDESTVGMFQPSAKEIAAAQRKRKTTARVTARSASMSLSIGAVHFSAAGPADEVLAKFHQFMEETFEQPMQRAIAGDKKPGGKK